MSADPRFWALEFVAVLIITALVARYSLFLIRHAIYLRARKRRWVERDRFRRLAPFDQEWQ